MQKVNVKETSISVMKYDETDYIRAGILKDLFDCKTCVMSVAQTYLKGIILPKSDCMFFLDVTPEESLRRIKSRNEEEEMFENIDALREARSKTGKVTYEWNVIPADDPAEIVSSKIVAKCLESEN